MPNEHSAEVICVNGYLVHLIPEENVFSDKLMSLLKKGIEMKELTKLSANFSRLTIFLNKSRLKSYV